ncbi:protein of unknown function [uncultured Sphingopyxis sp.]|uniref:Uncharacterized protein n=1 Tax=uncultured Sphingopyxis sp. TaxID=310581 RepID=A0A1Y5Q4X8_9SPHN|nr:protein of unknown function [uncultured Sphingopyxis sp.]
MPQKVGSRVKPGMTEVEESYGSSPTPKPAFTLLILHRHRNPPAIVTVVERRDLQPAAETKLQPAVGAKARCCRQVGDEARDARGAAMAAFEVDARGQDHAHLGAGFAAHGHDAGQREAAQIDDIAAHAARARHRIELDLAAHRADGDAAHIEPGFNLDAQRCFGLASRAAAGLVLRAEHARGCRDGRAAKGQGEAEEKPGRG